MLSFFSSIASDRMSHSRCFRPDDGGSKLAFNVHVHYIPFSCLSPCSLTLTISEVLPR